MSQVGNQSEVSKSITKLIKKLHEAGKKTVQEVGQLAVETSRNTTKFNNKLKDSTHFVSLSEYEGQVIDDREYAYYLEYGNDQNGPYIYPVNAKALHFYVNGHEVFAARVRAHSGYHFIQDGRDVGSQQVQDIFKRNFNEI